MKKQINIILLLVGFLTLINSCNERGKENIQREFLLREKLEELSDSIQIEGIVFKNLFKHQILAHSEEGFDSLLIINSVYKMHQQLWDNCYGMIFGEENAYKFNTPDGMVEWNKTLYPENREFFDERVESLLTLNLDSILENTLSRFNKLVPYKVNTTVSLLFTPLTGISFGGCEAEQFALELNHENWEPQYLIEKGLPHELNHLVYEPFRENDPLGKTALGQVIDEGFACYFSLIFFDQKITKFEAVENMSEEEWNWYVFNEKEILLKTKEYFYDESGNNPLLRNDKFQLFPEAPKSLAYWLGFRIIEEFVKNNGSESWIEIYELNTEDIYKRSGYEQYINSLK